MSTTLKSNILYSYIYQLLLIILPLITAPYISRILGPDGIGEYAYYYSITQYFLLFVMMGIVNYGSREISLSMSNNINDTKKTTSEIYLIQFLLLIIISIIYLFFIIFVSKNITLSIIFYLILLSGGIDISWLYFGLEKFKVTITRNLIIKALSLILIFCFVKSKSDITTYALIISLSTLLSQLYLWVKLPIKINIFKQKIKISHINNILILFIPVLAYSIYKIMDKIMLGYMSSIYELGLFDNSEKISFLPIGFITAIGTVLIPRMSKIFKENNTKIIEDYINTSFKIITYMSISISLGLICISRILAPVFFGKAFSQCSTIIIILATCIPFIAWANIIRTQYLIPKLKNKIYVVSSICGAIMNFVFNLYFIPKWGAIGAGYSTILAEITVFLYMSIKTNNNLYIFKRILREKCFIIIILITSILIYYISTALPINIISLVTVIAIGIVLYGIIIAFFIMKESNIISNKIRYYIKH